jgi:hypothetical protein
VNLSAYFGFQSLGIDMLTRSGSDIGSFGPAISLPIFNGGRLRGQFRSASASYDEAVANYDQAVTQALQDVADVGVSEKACRAAWRMSRPLPTPPKAYRIVSNRYNGGLNTSTYSMPRTRSSATCANSPTCARACSPWMSRWCVHWVVATVPPTATRAGQRHRDPHRHASKG